MFIKFKEITLGEIVVNVSHIVRVTIDTDSWQNVYTADGKFLKVRGSLEEIYRALAEAGGRG